MTSWTDVVNPVFGLYGPVDEFRQRFCAGIGLVAGANSDLDYEAVRNAVNQVDARHGYLYFCNAADSLKRVVITDADRRAVRKTWQIGLGGRVLVHARHQAGRWHS